MIKSVKFSPFYSNHLKNLTKIVSKIIKAPNIHVLSDNIGNLYSITPSQYHDLIHKRLHTFYTIANPSRFKMNTIVMQKLNVEDYAEIYTPNTPHCNLKKNIN